MSRSISRGCRWAIVMVVLMSFTPCSPSGGLGEVEKSYRRGEYELAAKLAERELARSGGVPSRLLIYYGLSLIALGREEQGRARLEEASHRDSSLARLAGWELRAMAVADLRGGNEEMAGEKLKLALLIHPSLELGGLVYALAKSCYLAKDYRCAVDYFRRALVSQPETTAAASAYLELAECYEKLGQDGEVLATLERYLKAYPRARNRSVITWQMANLLYRRAKDEMERGNYIQAIEAASRIPALADNVLLLKRAYFIMGRAKEMLGEYKEALEYFERILDVDPGSGGIVVEKAREKVRQYRKAGMR